MHPSTNTTIPISALAMKYPRAAIFEVVQSVLLAVRNNHTRYEPQIKQGIRQFIRIDGFRDSSKAIALRFQLLCEATATAVRHQPSLALVVFQAWVEIKQDLRWPVEHALARAGIATLPASAVLPREPTPGVLSALIDQLAETLADQDRSQIELMVICVSGQLPVDHEPELAHVLASHPSAASSPASAEPAIPALTAVQPQQDDEDHALFEVISETGATMIWDDILAQLAAVPAQNSAWDDALIEQFVQRLQAQAERKRAERAAPVRQLNELIGALKTEHADQLNFFSIDTAVQGWRAERLPPELLAQTTAQIHDLTALLQTYRQIDQRPAANLAERKLRDSERDQIEQRIEAAHTQLQWHFEQPHTRASEPVSLSAPPEPTPPAPAPEPTPAPADPDTADTTAPAGQLGHAERQNGFAAPDMPPAGQTQQQIAQDEPAHRDRDPADSPAPADQLEEIDLDEPLFSYPRPAPADQLEEIDLDEALFTDAWPAGTPWSGQPDPEPQAPGEGTAVEEPPEGVIPQIAWRLRHGQIDDRDVAYATLIWQLLLSEQYGLAYHLARLREGQSQPAPLPAALVRAIALAGNVCDDIGDSASLLKHDYSLFPPIGDHQSAYALLVAAATMQPALLAPSSGAPTMLSGVPQQSQLPHLHRYCQVIADYGQHMQPLDMRALGFVNNRAAWHTELTSLCRQVREWQHNASNKTNKYAPASAVWRRWLKHSGQLKQLLEQISEPEGKQLALVRTLIEELNDQETFRILVNDTDRNGLGRRGGDDIHGPALSQLRLHTREAIDLARRWVRLQEQQPTGQGNFFQERTAQLRRETQELHPLVHDELTAFAAQHEPVRLELEVALACCRRALERLQDLLARPDSAPLSERPPHLLIHAALLRSARISTDDGWEPLPGNEQLEPALLEIAETLGQSWDSAFETWCEQRDHEQTRRVLEVVQAHADYPDQHSLLQARRDRHLRDCQHALERDIDATRSHVESAVAYGLLREEERNGFVSRVQQIEHDQHSLLQFEPAHTRLDQIRQELNSVRTEKIASVHRRLASFQITPEHPAYARIIGVLDKSDALVADEYIDMVQRNEPLPEPQQGAEQQRTRFGEFYPDFMRESSRELEQNPNQSREITIQYLKQRTHGRARIRPALPLFEQRNLPGPEAATAAQAIEAWFQVKKAHKLDTALAAMIFDNLGFRVLTLTQEESGRITRFHLTTQQVRHLSPVRQYGSDAHGHYRLFCTWERPTETELISVLKGQPRDLPVLVCYFNRMTETRRKELARLCREQHITCLLLDDLLLLYLCTLPAPRLPHLFDCALPFTYLDPYTTIASVVPPEIFYGRQRERQQISDRMGSSFIYGGRQLGKTALLRDIEREQHNPERGRIVIWIDLKAEGIGNQRPIDDIWRIIADRLRSQGVLKDSGQVTAPKLIATIEAWLNYNQQRSILLLLDETDRFLDLEGRSERTAAGKTIEPFSRTSQIKGLMDRTDRRFKVVFAGLHNVKRTTRQSNNPLAHYGDPICIGPLLDNGEWRAARALIERPLSSLGFTFASPDLVTRILSQTNYYPSLIQLYCTQLIKQLTNPHAPLEGPPYEITSSHVEEVYRSQSLRDSIRERFRLTIQLDQRYEVIAYVVAYGSLSDDGRGLVEGFTVDWIREQALSFWEQGFRDSAAHDQIVALLDEMVGLGILRVVKQGFYTLRSPNVVLLMGTLDQIEVELLRNREPPIEYEPDSFRAAYQDRHKPDGMDVTRRSPLTARQMSEIITPTSGTAILFGCLAAERERVEPFLVQAAVQQPANEVCVCVLPPVSSRAEFRRELEQITEPCSSSRTTVVLVPESCPWSETWIDEAHNHMTKLRPHTSAVRVVFIADPSNAWTLVQQSGNGGIGPIHPHASLLSLGPWHDTTVRQWLEEWHPGLVELPVRQDIRKSTGNWPGQLIHFYEQTKTVPKQYWSNVITGMLEQHRAPDYQTALARQFELSPSLPLDVLRSIVQWGEGRPVPVVDIIDDLGESSAERIRLALRWADLMNFAHPAGNDTWQVDPLVQVALSGRS